MAAEATLTAELLAKFGPLRSYPTGRRVDTAAEPDRLVKTHCCFCGQQCGMQLKVQGNEVIGFEPWEEFPFNHGMLCPKGVNRYLQGSHPDRLTHAYVRDPSLPGGFRADAYDEAIGRVAAEIERIQSQYGPAAFAVLSGASLTTEKTYLMGKFARVCLKTPYIDYNGRLCMVSAAAGNKKAFGIDRAANPWSDILDAEVIWISGANVAECAPITTDYVWQAREHGANVIVVDPRITPMARTCDLFLPIKPGRDVALFNGILHLMIENDWVDQTFIDNHTVGFDQLAEHVQGVDAAADRRSHRHRRSGNIARRPSGGARPRPAFSCTPAASSTTATACRTCSGRSTSCWPRGASAGRAAATPRSPAKATARAAASTARSATSCPAPATSRTPSTAPQWPRSGAVSADELPHAGVDCLRDLPQGRRRARSAACSRSASIRWYPAGQRFRQADARKAGVLRRHRFLPQRDGPLCRHRAARFAARGGRRCRHAARRPRHQDQQGRRAARRRPAGLADYSRTSPARWAGNAGLRSASRARSSRNSARHRTAASPTIPASPTKRSKSHFGVFWPCPARGPDGQPIDHPGTPRLFEPGSWNPVAKGAGPFYFPDGKARFNVARYTPPTEEVDADYPLMLTTGRVVSQFLSRHPDAAHRSLGGSISRTAARVAPELPRSSLASTTAIGPRSNRGAGSITIRAQVVDHDPAGHGFCPLSLGGREEHQPRDNRRPGPDFQNSRIQGLRGPRAQGCRTGICQPLRTPAITCVAR